MIEAKIRLKSIIIDLFILIIVLLTSEIALGVPANPALFNITQPDNSSFQARQVGDEVASHFETLDGYTIVKDETKWWNYAKKDEKGKIVSIGQKVGFVKPEILGQPKHLHPSVAKTELISQKGQVMSVSASQIGAKKAIVILINFTDVSQNAGNTPSYYGNLLFNTSAGANSMHNYYKEVSYNNINITGDIADNRWFSAFRNLTWYGADITNRDENTTNPDQNDWYIFKLAKEAVIAADPYVNYSNYDGDGDGIIDHLIIVHAGDGQESTNVSTDIWSHKWDIQVWNGSAWNLGYTTNDGVKAVGYTMLAENSPLGTFAHEFGHDLGLPDLYDTDGTSSGVGYWDIMGSGNWLNNGNTPAHFSAWSKYFLGWVNPTKVTASLLNEQINQSETNEDVYMLLDNPGDSPGSLDWTSSGTGTGEYFLVENRKNISYDGYLPASGLLIWHIDESMGDNKNESHKLVDLEEADGLNHLDYNNTNGGNPGDKFDPWYSYVTGFTNIFNPNSKFYNGSASNVSVTNISASGYTMTANLIVSSSDWQSRKLTINGSTAGSQTNYPMKLTLYNTSGTDSPGVVYLNGSARSDFGDLRFTGSDGVTLLDYWIESYTPGASAVVWVEVDSIPASPGTASIYIYYGNPSAAGVSSGTATFTFFDDFESYSIGSTGSPVWSAAVSGWSVQSDGAGGKMMKKSGGESNSISTIPYVGGSISIDASLKHLDTNDLPQLLVNYISPQNFYTGVYGYLNLLAIYDFTYGIRASSGYAAPENTWLTVSLIKNTNTLIANVSTNSVSWTAPGLGSYPMGIRMGGTATGAFDNFRIRTYANPEPAWGA